MIQDTSRLRSDNNAPSIFRIIDITILVFSLIVAIGLYGVAFNKDYLLLLTLTLTIFFFLTEAMGLYRKLRLGKFAQRIMVIFASTTLTFLLATFALFLFKESETFSRVVHVIWFVLSLFGFIMWRVAYRHTKEKLYKNGINLRKVAIIGLNPVGRNLLEQIKKYPELGLDFIGFYDDREPERLEGDLSPLKGKVNDLLKLAQDGTLDSVYICIPLVAEARITKIIQTLSDSTVNVFMVPDFLLSTLIHGNIGNLGNVDTISVFEEPISGSKEFYKRSFDIIFSLFALVITSPILLAIAIAIKTTSKGPVLFRQCRYGLDGRKIGVHKFRSMKVMENSDTVVQATKNDSRITKVGAFLRKTSLDELPQFFDVLIGNMSVVGPRPHAVAHNEEYRKLVNYYMLRHKVKPGITGWAQINGWRGETDTLEKMEKRVEYDLQYIRNWSLWWDIKIVFLTVFKGFIHKNAY
ncbi:undecaprenyl-phosphate glucose phosphotransferase [Thiosulfativibrio zosterae]|uniref:Undecaprenyl-phosphate glucose phosphotransferase n=1 Tax=Thiosulfativibrio zosterae TaxID=2675053 RepID=A0A6F8PQV2_9GAMM|nr:undecaprenyl-phosphate glucose phosphotransferase [Thiosulfativibrio zosterae]BBP44501.1 undecaprenyl-phosphate glucose phosphotransferase [Thiosulfativibrio zosterae]